MDISKLKPTERFSDCVQDYATYRPGYPKEVVDFLRNDLGLRPTYLIADVGSGTGIFSKLLLENGNRVYGIEPNLNMRKAAEEFLFKYPQFKSINATAEKTGLLDHSVDFITASQAFHWFDPDKAKKEFKRILKPQGYVVLIWNERKTKDSAFLKAYEAMLIKYAIEYQDTKNFEAALKIKLDGFFNPSGYQKFECPNEQAFDLEGLLGRLRSVSYAPKVDHPNFKPMMEALRQAFDQYQVSGIVKFEYTTEVYYGLLS